MLHIIFQNLRKRRIQALAILVSVLLSVAAILALVLVFAGIPASVQSAKDRLGADMMVLPQGASKYTTEKNLLYTGAPLNTYMKADVLDELAGTGARRWTPQVFCSSAKADSCCATSYIMVGIDPETDWVISPWLRDEGVDIAQLGPNEAVAGCDVTDFQTGPVTIMGSDISAVAQLDRTNTSLDSYIVVSIDTMRELMANGSRTHQMEWQRYGAVDELVSAVMVDTGDATPDEERATANIIRYRTGCDVVAVGDSMERQTEQMGSIFSIMAIVTALLVAIAVFQLLARYFSTTWNRRSELGLYLALGATRGYVRRLILGEVLLLTGVAAVLGCALGGVLYASLGSTLSAATAYPFTGPSAATTAIAAVGVVVAFLVVGTLAVSASLAKVGKLDPSSVMRHEDIG